VLAVYDDGDLGVYKHENAKTKDEVDKSRKQAGSTSGDGEKMGETDYWDEFLDSGSKPAGTIMFGSSWDGEIENRHQQSLSMDLYTIMKNSTHGGIFDIKVGRSFEGRRIAGKYASARSAGNYLAGYNASTGTEFGGKLYGFDQYMRLAGVYQSDGFRGVYEHLWSGKTFGPAPYYGETSYTGRMIYQGWKKGRPQ